MKSKYPFSIKSRFEPLIEEDTLISIIFNVDAVQGPGIRVFTLITETSVNNTANVEIYAEDVEDLAITMFQIQYDADLLSLDPDLVTRGELFNGIEEVMFFTEVIDSNKAIEVAENFYFYKNDPRTNEFNYQNIDLYNYEI